MVKIKLPNILVLFESNSKECNALGKLENFKAENHSDSLNCRQVSLTSMASSMQMY